MAEAALGCGHRCPARHLGARGVRCDLAAARLIRSMAARSVPGFAGPADGWAHRAPTGWDRADAGPTARVAAGAAVALLPDLFSAAAGGIVRVNGGVACTRWALERAPGTSKGAFSARLAPLLRPDVAPGRTGRRHFRSVVAPPMTRLNSLGWGRLTTWRTIESGSASGVMWFRSQGGGGSRCGASVDRRQRGKRNRMTPGARSLACTRS